MDVREHVQAEESAEGPNFSNALHSTVYGLVLC